MVVDKEDLQFLRQQQRAFLEDQVDGLKHKVADLILTGNHGDEGCADFVVVSANGLSVREIVHVADDKSN